MPLGKKDREMKRHFTDEYGDEGDRAYYATLNKRINEGRPIRTPESKHLKAKRRRTRAKAKRRRTHR